MSTNGILHLLEQAAHWAWSSSLAVCVPALLLLVLGFWKGFPVRWRIVLAVVVALRLALPVVPGLPGHPSGWWTGGQLPVVESVSSATDGLAVQASNHGAPAAAASPISPWVLLWLAGVAATLGWTLASHMLLKRRLTANSDHPGDHLESLLIWCSRRAEVHAPIDFRLVHGLSTPAIYGWRTPMLLLPADIESRHTDDEIRGMILHELMHIRQGDGFWNWAALAVCSLHWFNPLAWLCLRRYHADREIVCDQGALSLLLPQQRHAYGHALLKTWETVSAHQPALLTPFLRRRTETYTRILMSIQPTRQRRVVQLLAIATVPALSLFSLTTVRADREPGKKPAESEEGRKSAEGEGTRKSAEGEREGSKSKSRRARDGERKEGEGDGAQRKTGARDGEGSARKGPRDGEGEKKGPRDGEGSARKGPRDGEGGSKTGARDGDGGTRKGPRDGEGERKGPRDGEGERKSGPRDGEGERKAGPRDGEGAKKEGAGDRN